MNKLFLVCFVAMLAGCAATPLNTGALGVEIANAAKDVKKCTFVGDVMGSQGNRFSGGFTSNENLMLGARNSIKNEAARVGANRVLIQQQHNTPYFMAGGTSNSTLIGKAYQCGG